MISSSDLIVAVGPALFEVVVPGKGDREVRDVFLADPQEPATGQPGDLVLGLGLRDAEDAVELVERCVAGNASGPGWSAGGRLPRSGLALIAPRAIQ